MDPTIQAASYVITMIALCAALWMVFRSPTPRN